MNSLRLLCLRLGEFFRNEDGGFSWGNIEGGLLVLGRNWIGKGVGRVEFGWRSESGLFIKGIGGGEEFI